MNTTTPKTILRLRRGTIFSDTFSLFMAHRFEDGRIALPQPMILTVIEPTQAIPKENPLVSFDSPEAQRLMDDLWNLGIRPTEGHGSTGQLAATEKHLDHVTHLLADAFKTVQNVVNASIVTQHQLPVTPKV